MHYLVYFAGPFLLGVFGATRLAQPFRIFVVGLIAFLLAWLPMQTITGIATQALGVVEGTLVYAVIVSAAAGLFEESARYIAFRRCAVFRDNHNWRSSLTYALGHHGMETIIVGLTVALITVVVTFKPDAISDPNSLQQCQTLVAAGAGTKLYQSIERLTVGLLIHVCFSGVVMLAVVRAQPRWLFCAGAWHFLHDMVGFNLHNLSTHWLVSKLWIALIVIGYSYLVVRIYRALARPAPATAHPPVGPPPMILPGRQA